MKREININISHAELIYDIDNKLHLIGRNRQQEDAVTAAHIQADEMPENRNFIIRKATEAIDTAKASMAHYIEDYGTAPDNTLNEEFPEGSTTFYLLMPSNFNMTLEATIATLTHDFIVNYVCSEWLKMSAPQDAAVYAEDAQKTLQALTDTLNSRVRPYRVLI